MILISIPMKNNKFNNRLKIGTEPVIIPVSVAHNVTLLHETGGFILLFEI